ncbi:sigma 54-interacting transcriptional regulator [Corallococcus carmarthensis]|uniref:Sigma-54-dependent Fis family transcriptional regulator n=1 Tax=Corallococcus carmarthensis TaxID=2316728 RepID=A0A3A8KI90_9BACT|nr:sigma 54-interacting transcriptional regulator [Corallococcus carmarthensis]NOK17608.1 sigma-54-dependent Fis family transcriptional regulator [Corallococcus carmarthensis]RKH06799.1 sigma-54-dependent Fis family transcriptional regulator [Corallococcus carmarthensis]
MPHDPLADLSTAAMQERGASRGAPRAVPALTVVSHPVPRRVGDRRLLDAVVAGRPVALSRNAPDFAKPGSSLGLPLADPFVSRKPLEFSALPDGGVRLTVPEDGTHVVAAGVLLLGTRDFSPPELMEGVALELSGRVVLLLHQVELDGEGAAETLDMVGESAGLRRLRRHIERVADLDVSVLIRGETGTGKELVAQAIHRLGPRKAGRFVSVNLGAIPKELAAAELFGSQKGAYSGATRDREGFFRAAHGGTLFLDEVGEAPPEVQVMLLRVLETGELYPVGASQPVTVDVRLIAATDAHLEEQIRDGRFKAPLLHRLAGYDLRVPALRERREDVGRLFFHFAREELAALGEAARLDSEDPHAEPWLPAPLASRLVRAAWPGNIRQLRNLTRQLVIGSRGQARLQADSQLDELLGVPEVPVTAAAPVRVAVAPEAREAAVPRRKPSQVTEAELLAALRASAWDLKAAADALGIPRPSVYDLIDKSPNLRTAGDLGADEITRCFEACGGDLDAMVRTLEVSKRALGRRLKELGLVAKGT